MATITVRNLPDNVQRRLKQRAVENNRSMEAEVRAILNAAVTARGFGRTWVEVLSELEGEDLPIPERSQPRSIDL